jgi:4'-phosphopantetheinyl transferase EntD
LIDFGQSNAPGLLSLIAPPNTIGVDILDYGQTVTIPEQEWDYLGDAGPIRRREFALGRHCAHEALKQFCAGEEIIARGRKGEPVWPSGMAGSITHTRGYAAALVAPIKCLVGIDAERVTDLSDSVARQIFLDEERVWLAGFGEKARNVVSTTIFSAKEAYYKALLANRAPLSFQGMRVELGQGVFSVCQVGSNSDKANGSFVVVDDLVLTAISVCVD